MTKITRRTALGATAATSLALTAPRLHAQTAPKITYWHHFTSQEEFTGLKRVMEMFKQRFPTVALTQENIPNPEYMTKFTAAVMAKTRPDITMIVAERLPDMLAMDGLVDVTQPPHPWS